MNKNLLTQEHILYALKNKLTAKVDIVCTVTGEVKNKLLKEYTPLYKYYANDYFFNLLESKINLRKPKSISKKDADYIFEDLP